MKRSARGGGAGGGGREGSRGPHGRAPVFAVAVRRADAALHRTRPLKRPVTRNTLRCCVCSLTFWFSIGNRSVPRLCLSSGRWRGDHVVRERNGVCPCPSPPPSAALPALRGVDEAEPAPARPPA